jgi:hypothetical protein
MSRRLTKNTIDNTGSCCGISSVVFENTMLGSLVGLDGGASKYDRDGGMALPFDFEATYPTR